MPSPPRIRRRANLDLEFNNTRTNRPNGPISYNSVRRTLSFGNTNGKARRLSFGTTRTVGRNGNNLPRIPNNLNAINEKKLRNRTRIEEYEKRVNQHRKNKINAAKRNPKTPSKNNTRKRPRSPRSRRTNHRLKMKTSPRKSVDPMVTFSFRMLTGMRSRKSCMLVRKSPRTRKS